MKSLVVCSLLIVSAWAMPQGYNIDVPDNSLNIGGGAALGGGIPLDFGPAVGGPISCAGGLVLDTYTGGCVAPIVTRNIYVYAAPEQPRPAPRPISVPPPKVDYNIVFVRSPENNAALDPIIVPPPQQRTLVYVLSKKQAGGQRVIEVPAGPASNPEVYFVNYGPGENPQLPGGVDLQSALGAAASAPGAGGFGGNTDFGGVAGFGGNTGFGGVGRADEALVGLGGAGLGGAGDLGGAGGFGGAGFGGAGQGGAQSFAPASQSAGGFGGAGQGGAQGFGAQSFAPASQSAGGFGGAGQGGAQGFGGQGGFGGSSGFGGGVGLGGVGNAGGIPLAQ